MANPTVLMMVFTRHDLLVICLLTAAFLYPRAAEARDGQPAAQRYFGRLAFPQAAVAAPHTIHVPFQFAGRLIAVEARIDTFVGTFIIDTGAERLLLNQRYFRARARPTLGAAIGNTGDAGPVLRRQVDSLHWDNLFFLDVSANVLDLSHIERKKNIRLLGIIGYEVLKDFEILLDYRQKQLVLTRLDEQGYRLDSGAIWETPADSLDFKRYGHLIILEAEVGGSTLQFNLDSGAELNLLDRRVRRRVLDDFEIVKRVKMIGAGQQTIEVLAGTLYRVRCGNQYSESMRTLLTSLTEMNGHFGVRMDGVLGYEFLATRRTLINYKREKLFFFAEPRP